MRSCFFFNNDSITVQIAFPGETSGLMDELARLVRLEPSDDPGGIRVVVYSSERPPDEIVGILRGAGAEGRWRSYNVANRIRVLESPDRDVFLCGVREYPSRYPTRQVRGNLVSMVVGSVLALLSDRLLLIHGALLANGGSGYVLTGPSGVGKSTAASRVSPPWRALADDLVAAVSTPEGYVLYPLPTWSRLDTDPSLRPGDLNEPCPLSGLYFLEQSPADAIEAIPPNDAVARLLSNSYQVYRQHMAWFSDEDRLRCRREVLMHAARILDRTPCGILKVSMAGRFWEKIPT